MANIFRGSTFPKQNYNQEFKRFNKGEMKGKRISKEKIFLLIFEKFFRKEILDQLIRIQICMKMKRIPRIRDKED